MNEYAGLLYFNDCRKCGHYNGKRCEEQSPCHDGVNTKWIPQPIPLTPENTPGIEFKKTPVEVLPKVSYFDDTWKFSPLSYSDCQRIIDARWMLGHYSNESYLRGDTTHWFALTQGEFDQLRRIAGGAVA